MRAWRQFEKPMKPRSASHRLGSLVWINRASIANFRAGSHQSISKLLQPASARGQRSKLRSVGLRKDTIDHRSRYITISIIIPEADDSSTRIANACLQICVYSAILTTRGHRNYGITCTVHVPCEMRPWYRSCPERVGGFPTISAIIG